MNQITNLPNNFFIYSARIKYGREWKDSQNASLRYTLIYKLGFLIAPKVIFSPENARQASTLCLPCLFGDGQCVQDEVLFITHRYYLIIL
jgi:hypothetical protein